MEIIEYNFKFKRKYTVSKILEQFLCVCTGIYVYNTTYLNIKVLKIHA